LMSPQSHLRELFKMEGIRMMLDEHAAGRRNWHTQLWYLLILESWFQAQLTRATVCVA
jgi:hypothetical protein